MMTNLTVINQSVIIKIYWGLIDNINLLSIIFLKNKIQVHHLKINKVINKEHKVNLQIYFKNYNKNLKQKKMILK
jgi:hypothetical protein